MNEMITIDVLTGGFVLTYPVFTTVDGKQDVTCVREVFTSPGKLNKKLKEVIAAIGLVTDN